MQKDDLAYVGHMIDMATAAMNKIDNVSRDQFDDDENLRLAVTHLVQTVGEAARRVSPELQQRYPAVPWPKVIGMRHKVVHDYLHVDYDIVWDVVTQELPPLVTALERIAKLEEGP